MKYTTETRLYIKNNKDIVEYFDEVKEQYSYILRKVYYIIRNNPKLKTNLLNTKLQNEYNISSRTADSIIKTVQGRINSIKELKKTEIKQKKYKLEKISEELKKLIPILLDLKLKAEKNDIKDLIKYRNLKIKVAFMKIKKDKLINKINSLNYQIETNKFKITFGTKEFLKKRDNQIIFVGRKEEKSCNSTFQLKYISKINQFIIKIRKDLTFNYNGKEYLYSYGKDTLTNNNFISLHENNKSHDEGTNNIRIYKEKKENLVGTEINKVKYRSKYFNEELFNIIKSDADLSSFINEKTYSDIVKNGTDLSQDKFILSKEKEIEDNQER